MGRKVGKHRSKRLNFVMGCISFGWDTPYGPIGLTKHQWKNFLNHADIVFATDARKFIDIRYSTRILRV